MNCRPLRPVLGKKAAIINDQSGNAFRHDLYDYGPRWLLEGRRRGESEAEGEAPVQYCLNAECGALIAIISAARIVELFWRGRGRVPQQTSRQLEQINEDRQLELMLQYMPYRRAVEWAEGDYDRLAYVARVRGYKPGLGVLSVVRRERG